jgi:hypothetical protein
MRYKHSRIQKQKPRVNQFSLMKIKYLALALVLTGMGQFSTFAVGLSNSDFELPAIGTGGLNYISPPPGFGWSVASGDFDLIGNYWQASSGQQSVDLNGFAQGSIYQDFTFPTMGTWSIKFNMSANPDTAGLKSLRVDFGLTGGAMSSLGTFSLNSTGRTYANMLWTEFNTASVNISAPGSYRVQFSSLTPGASGPALDNVSLVQVPEPSIAAMAIVAMAIITFGFGYPRMRKQKN